MRIPNQAHTSRPWRIHEFTRDFRLEDVWMPPEVGGAGDFPRLVELIASHDPAHSASAAVRTLFAVRWKLGALLGWDAPNAGVGARVPTLRDRLPADLRSGPTGPDFDGSFWDSVDPTQRNKFTNPPPGFADPDDGYMILAVPNTAEFHSSAGGVAMYTRRTKGLIAGDCN